MSQFTKPSRRLFRHARGPAKQALVRVDLAVNGRIPTVRRWAPALAAPTGHVVTPTRAIVASLEEALDLASRDVVHPGDRVLDVGAGNGRQAIGLLQFGVAEYVGLEIVQGSVDYGNRTFADTGRARFVHFDVQNDMYNPGGRVAAEKAEFPFADKSFDVSVAGSLYTHLEHMSVVEHYVDETARVLRPGGRAFMSFFRSPPNEVNSSAVRSVFHESDVRTAVDKHFEIVDSCGGETDAYHDQWRLYLRKH